jgi:hypothetical protein
MKRGVTLAGLLLVLAASGADATSVAGIDLPARRDDLALHGAGLLRKGLFFKIYVGALYVARPEDATRILSDVPKRLDIHYFHRTPKKHMVRVAEKTLRKNLTPAEYSALAPMIKALHEAYRDGRKGGCASLVHRPGEGLTYMVDDEEVLAIEDDTFANAYLQVWLGDYPSSATMKEALLRPLEESS